MTGKVVRTNSDPPPEPRLARRLGDRAEDPGRKPAAPNGSPHRRQLRAVRGRRNPLVQFDNVVEGVNRRRKTPVRRAPDAPGKLGEHHGCDLPERDAGVPARTSSAARARGGAAARDGGGGGPVEGAAAGRRGARGLFLRLHWRRWDACYGAPVPAVSRRGDAAALPPHLSPP